MIGASDFYVTLPSNTHAEYRTGKYTVRLPHTLRLDGSWEVSLTEIWFPHSWNNIDATATPSDFNSDTENEITITLKNQKKLKVKLQPGYYETPYQFIFAIKQDMDAALDQYRAEGSIYHSADGYGDDVDFTYDIVHKRISINLKFLMVEQIIFSEKLQYMLGLAEPTIKTTQTTGKYPLDLRAGIDALYVYSNIIVPQIVGNVYRQLIRICDVTADHGDIVHQVFHSPNYLPVLVHELNTIDIIVGTDLGTVVPFLYGNVICKLHFRKKRFSLI